MNAVLDKIGQRSGVDTEELSKLRKLLNGLARLGRRGGRFVLAVAPTATPLAMRAVDPTVDPAVVEIVRAGVDAAASGVSGLLEEPNPTTGVAESSEPEQVTDPGVFRTRFGALVDSLDGVDAVVVFIDDLDRCLPETVVDTFEAIRLFLNTPKTAYVVAANQAVVESAIDSRYPQLRRPDGTGVGADYLEKMLQLKVAIPPLSAPEADTYVNLLLAELRLSADDFAAVIAETRKQRAASNLQVAFNLGVAGSVLNDKVPTELIRDLQWAAGISEILGAGLRGNPRQLKRFLNNLLLKHRSAQRRDVTLELPVLAKLMALEEQHFTDFERLFGWQLTTAGPIPELAAAEAAAKADKPGPGSPPTEATSVVGEENKTKRPGRGGGATSTVPDTPASLDKRTPEDVRLWADKPHIRAWLNLDPPLGSTDLRPYFTYSRDKLTFGVAVSRLPAHLQALLSRVQTEVDGARRQACDEVAQLLEGERAQLVEALLDAVTRHPAGPGFVAALEVAERASDTVSLVCGALTKIPPAAVPVAAAGQAVLRLPRNNAEVVALLDRWQHGDSSALTAVMTQARQASQRSGRG